MNPPLAARLLALLACLAVNACNKPAADYYPGYAEADYVRLAPAIGGRLTKLFVHRGEQAAANAPAFVLEQDSERAAREEAAAGVERAQAQLANLKKGKRPDEVAAAAAQLAQAQAAQKLSAADLARQEKLVRDKFISAASLDQAQAAFRRDAQRVTELQAQLRIAKLGARPDEVAAAEQEVKAAEAALAQADWKLEQKSQRMPVSGLIDDVLYREGELVPAGSPVISLLPPQNIKARFFVPEAALGRIAIGQQVELRCDGCGKPIPAAVSFIAPEAEYTAPLIYSKETRATLVFMVEARPSAADAARLHPGQPLEVWPIAPQSQH